MTSTTGKACPDQQLQFQVFTPANTSAAGVATGAVMRAQNKEHGPKRIPQRSFGVRVHVPDEPDTYSEDVLRQLFSEAEVSGESYIKNTLKWIIKAVMFFI
jgi:hypothetical protein